MCLHLQNSSDAFSKQKDELFNKIDQEANNNNEIFRELIVGMFDKVNKYIYLYKNLI